MKRARKGGGRKDGVAQHSSRADETGAARDEVVLLATLFPRSHRAAPLPSSSSADDDDHNPGSLPHPAHAPQARPGDVSPIPTRLPHSQRYDPGPAALASQRRAASDGQQQQHQALKAPPAPPRPAIVDAVGVQTDPLPKMPRSQQQKEANLLAFDGPNTFTIAATEVATGKKVEITYQQTAVAGNGSFGVVVRAKLLKGGTGIVALKRTKQDRRFKNREYQIMCVVKHPNIVNLRYYWYEASPNADEVFLNLVLEYIPETLYRTYRAYSKRREHFPEILTKLYIYQVLRALAYLHARGICHRDIKPHNIMIDEQTGRCVLIDFGSAKVLKEGEPNVSYTCSRYYRAPELIFGSTKYSNSIDIWSTGCILGELLHGSVFFPGQSGIDQLVEIIKVLGTPTRDEIRTMNPSYVEHQFPQIKAVALEKLLLHSSPEALTLLSSFLTFSPPTRPAAIEALAHPFFDELRYPPSLSSSATGEGEGEKEKEGEEEEVGRARVRMPNGKVVGVELFDFSIEELSVRPDLVHHLVPSHYAPTLLETKGIDVARFEPVDVEGLRVCID
ncbi:hypothetical protein JCM6882_004286 [Rhodosporidiobolus microsporus]